MRRALADDAHTAHAVNVDRDDPFLRDRLLSHADSGVGRTADYSTTRRTPAPIEDRFRLVRPNKR